MRIANVGCTAPEFDLQSILATDPKPQSVKLSDYSGRWLILIFYPRDFTFVCPTELTAFSAHRADFEQRHCDLLGISADSIEMHREWLSTSPSEGGLGPLEFPLGSDPEGQVASAYGIWIDEKKVPIRGLFLIDPDGILQYAVIHNLNVGRSPKEVLRVLDALQTGGLCPANWTAADGTIDLERALQQGKIIGHYKIQKKLGHGSFGTVFSAWDLRLERMVALKILKRSIWESHKAVLAESRAAAKLNHPHVCTVYAIEEEEGLPLIAMEYLDGRPLSALIAEGLQIESAWEFAAQIATGMAAAHDLGIVHGDLKPANILVTQGGTVKILDFGLANSHSGPRPSMAIASAHKIAASQIRLPQAEDRLAETIDFQNKGTDPYTSLQGSLAYMSPEQMLGLAATPASDVFSLGLTIIEMVSGRRVRSEQSPGKTLLNLHDENLEPVVQQCLDEKSRGLIGTMLAKDPTQRPTMNQIGENIRAQFRLQ